MATESRKLRWKTTVLVQVEEEARGEEVAVMDEEVSEGPQEKGDEEEEEELIVK